eukprot:scaffold130260_cov50-Attheya_sp.AAC.1
MIMRRLQEGGPTLAMPQTGQPGRQSRTVNSKKIGLVFVFCFFMFNTMYNRPTNLFYNSNTNVDPSPAVCLFLFTKDSPGMLRTWLSHHLTLFDVSSITIVDHSSQSQDVLDQLASVSARGGDVIRFTGSFSNKQHELSRIMKHRAPHCDFLVPLDTDELLAVHYGSVDVKNTYAVSSRKAMEDEFKKLRQTIGAGMRYKFGMVSPKLCSLEACMGDVNNSTEIDRLYLRSMSTPRPSTIEDFPPDNVCQHKTFYPANVFSSTDQGNHFGTLTSDTMRGRNSRKCGILKNTTFYYPEHHGLVLLHLDSALPFQWFRDKYVQAANAYGYTAKTDCSTIKLGSHYCTAMNEAEKNPGKSKLVNYTRYCKENLGTRENCRAAVQ